MSYHEIAAEVLGAYTDGLIPRDEMRAICGDAYDYEVPLEPAGEGVHLLRLDRGPTASFKDFAARMMARLIGRFLHEDGGHLTILTATSGDTGAAVASAFHGIEGIRVVVLFPIDEVSERQRRQMTTLGGNIQAIAIDGKFDDCQAMVKHAFADPELSELALSSANSINIGRLLPQSVYYFYAASRVASGGEPVTIVVPSGNFGNMMGAVLAREAGLPVERLVVPVNENDEFPVFLETGDYQKIDPSRNSLSNAMNVGHPSNLARLVQVYGGHLDHEGRMHRMPDMDAMRHDLHSVSVSDDATRETIRRVWRERQVLLEPHGAVAWRGYGAYREQTGKPGTPAVVVETAHPAKFPGEIQRLLGFDPEPPAAIAALDTLDESFERMGRDYGAFKEFIEAHCKV